jgi:hypothetical protein
MRWAKLVWAAQTIVCCGEIGGIGCRCDVAQTRIDHRRGQDGPRRACSRPTMLKSAPGVKVYLACKPEDMRRGFDGLAADVAQTLRADPLFGSGISYSAASAATT